MYVRVFTQIQRCTDSAEMQRSLEYVYIRKKETRAVTITQLTDTVEHKKFSKIRATTLISL